MGGSGGSFIEVEIKNKKIKWFYGVLLLPCFFCRRSSSFFWFCHTLGSRSVVFVVFIVVSTVVVIVVVVSFSEINDSVHYRAHSCTFMHVRSKYSMPDLKNVLTCVYSKCSSSYRNCSIRFFFVQEKVHTWISNSFSPF